MGGVIRRRRIATTPRNPWEGVRIVKELQLVGEFGLRNKTELWTHLTMVKSHKSQAKKLLITTNKEEFMTEGRALLNYLYKMGIISGVDYNDEADISRCLKEVLNLDLSHYLNRRLQSLVFKAGLATNIHHARCLIVQKQITVMGRVVNKPSMLVRSEVEGHIEINPNSCAGGAKKGRNGRKEEGEAEE